MKRGCRCLVIILGLVLLARCRRPPATNPRILDPITDSEPACWLEICPGSTTWDEALTVLDGHPGISIANRDPSHPLHPSIRWSVTAAAEEEGLVRGVLWTNAAKGVIQTVDLYPGDRLTLGEVVERLGLPSAVIAAKTSRELTFLHVRLGYPERGIVVAHLDRRWSRSAKTVYLESALRVSYVRLLAADQAETLEPWMSLDAGEDYHVPWPGWDASLEVFDLR